MTQQSFSSHIQKTSLQAGNTINRNKTEREIIVHLNSNSAPSLDKNIFTGGNEETRLQFSDKKKIKHIVYHTWEAT